MRKRNYKGRCEKKMIHKCEEICKTYDAVQSAYADILSSRNDIKEIRCNVLLDDTEYTSDFVWVKDSGVLMVRKCIYQKQLTKPMTVKLLEESG